MYAERDLNPLPNSAAIPLPTARNSAAGRHPKTVVKLLIFITFARRARAFLTLKRVFPLPSGKCVEVRLADRARMR